MEKMLIMVKRNELSIGIYEKAMPDNLSWEEKLNLVQETGFDFLELSIDESDFRLSRLENIEEQNCILKAISSTGVPIRSICLSAHRKYPLGSHEKEIQKRSLAIMEKALHLAPKIGVQRIQLAGYDVYYEESDDYTQLTFEKNLKKCVDMASMQGVVLGFETMETSFMNTVEKAMKHVNKVDSPYLQVYPDLGNLYNGNMNKAELLRDIERGAGHYIAVHLKDTVPNVFRDLQFTEGNVDFKEGIEIFYQHGVRIFNCEIWDNKSGDYKECMLNTMKIIESCIIETD
jgi:hexulose-6-phosphate isomerase, putative